jgi:hypothetical protein
LGKLINNPEKCMRKLQSDIINTPNLELNEDSTFVSFDSEEPRLIANMLRVTMEDLRIRDSKELRAFIADLRPDQRCDLGLLGNSNDFRDNYNSWLSARLSEGTRMLIVRECGHQGIFAIADLSPQQHHLTLTEAMTSGLKPGEYPDIEAELICAIFETILPVAQQGARDVFSWMRASRIAAVRAMPDFSFKITQHGALPCIENDGTDEPRYLLHWEPRREMSRESIDSQRRHEGLI